MASSRNTGETTNTASNDVPGIWRVLSLTPEDRDHTCPGVAWVRTPAAGTEQFSVVCTETPISSHTWCGYHGNPGYSTTLQRTDPGKFAGNLLGNSDSGTAVCIWDRTAEGSSFQLLVCTADTPISSHTSGATVPRTQENSLATCYGIPSPSTVVWGTEDIGRTTNTTSPDWREADLGSRRDSVAQPSPD
ncbi:hypothetical protein Bbelb_108660 [Branchiostoma belcheri]|nr:hypothetical protein Bbelb_108660 [Branchiostoma belcheri]